MNSRFRIGCLVVCLATGTGPIGLAAAASLPGPEARVVATDDEMSDWFGRSVDIYGNIAVSVP